MKSVNQHTSSLIENLEKGNILWKKCSSFN